MVYLGPGPFSAFKSNLKKQKDRAINYLAEFRAFNVAFPVHLLTAIAK